MADYMIANGTASELTNVNAGGSDVPAYSVLDAVTLTTTELAALLATAGVAVLKTTPTSSQRHFAAKVLKLGSNPGA